MNVCRAELIVGSQVSIALFLFFVFADNKLNVIGGNVQFRERIYLVQYVSLKVIVRLFSIPKVTST